MLRVGHLREGHPVWISKQDPLVWSEKLDLLRVLKTEKKGMATNAGEWVQADRGAIAKRKYALWVLRGSVQGKIPRTLQMHACPDGRIQLEVHGTRTSFSYQMKAQNSKKDRDSQF
jgi:hypothetical protein